MKRPVFFLFITALLVFLAAGCAMQAGPGGPSVRDDPPLVLFDTGHGQRFLPDRDGELDLSGLAGVFQSQGWRVQTLSGRVNAGALEGADALVISGPFAPFSPREAEAVADFVARGGAVAVMLHIAPPVNDLLGRLGVKASNGTIREIEPPARAGSTDFTVTNLTGHDLFYGLDRFRMYGAWALEAAPGRSEIVASTSSGAWLEPGGEKGPGREGARMSLGVVAAGAAGQGRFVVFGDDALFQNRFLDGGNRILAGNLARWLWGDGL